MKEKTTEKSSDKTTKTMMSTETSLRQTNEELPLPSPADVTVLYTSQTCRWKNVKAAETVLT